MMHWVFYIRKDGLLGPSAFQGYRFWVDARKEGGCHVARRVEMTHDTSTYYHADPSYSQNQKKGRNHTALLPLEV